MRRCDEVIEVRQGRIGQGFTDLAAGGVGDADPTGGFEEGPSQFLWRQRLWRVLRVQSRWMESGAWWESSAVRGARGDWEAEHGGERFDTFEAPQPVSAPVVAPHEGDLLCEQEVWRVEAANGQFLSRGVYELAHALADGSWRLRAVVD